MTRFELTILGYGTPFPTVGRFTTSQILVIHDQYLMIDCGEGAQILLDQYNIKRSRIQHIFISHLHGDHYFGVLGLLGSFRLTGRTYPLHLYAPKGLEELIAFELKLSQSEPYPFPICFHPTDAQGVHLLVETPSFTVHSFPLKHRIPTTGFLFKEKDKERKMKRELIETYQIPHSAIRAIKRGADWQTPDGQTLPNHALTLDPEPPLSYAYCSDTAYYEPLIPIIKGVNCLYHEATFGMGIEKDLELGGHSNTAQAATIALKAAVGQLIIGHFSSRYQDLEVLRAEAAAIFPNTHLAEQGKKFVIG